jgi:hypothetical protein
MNFVHKQLNKIFGFPDSHDIPYIRIDNPLVYVLDIQKQLKKSNTRFELQKENDDQRQERLN